MGYYGEPITTDAQATQIMQNWVNTNKPIIMANPVYVSSITISGGDIVTNTGAWFTKDLTATVAPSNATYPYVTWTSSNPDIASVYSYGGVEKMVVSGHEGAATITATDKDGSGVVGTLGVSVISASTPVVSMYVGNTLTPGDSNYPAFIHMPSGIYASSWKYVSTNPNIITTTFADPNTFNQINNKTGKSLFKIF